MDYRDIRQKELLGHLASEFIASESNRKSLITVTNTEVTKDFKKALIFVTVFPENQEKAVLDFLKRQRSTFKQYVKANSKLPRVPQFDFMIDSGEKSRQRIDEISYEINRKN